MKKNQYLLLKLMEECAEVSHRASKQIQFGKDERQKDQLESNRQRLKGEILDLLSVVMMLEQIDEIPVLTPTDAVMAAFGKREKMKKYLAVSHQLGQLPEIEL